MPVTDSRHTGWYFATKKSKTACTTKKYQMVSGLSGRDINIWAEVIKRHLSVNPVDMADMANGLQIKKPVNQIKI